MGTVFQKLAIASLDESIKNGHPVVSIRTAESESLEEDPRIYIFNKFPVACLHIDLESHHGWGPGGAGQGEERPQRREHECLSLVPHAPSATVHAHPQLVRKFQFNCMVTLFFRLSS